MKKNEWILWQSLANDSIVRKNYNSYLKIESSSYFQTTEQVIKFLGIC